METAAEAERAAKHVRREERARLKGELNAWEACNKRKLKHSDLERDPELSVKYRRYRELSKV